MKSKKKVKLEKFQSTEQSHLGSRKGRPTLAKPIIVDVIAAMATTLNKREKVYQERTTNTTAKKNANV